MELHQPNAQIWDCTHEEYHSDRLRISHSTKEVFRFSKKLYWETYVAGLVAQRSQTRELYLGGLLHMLVLEPDLFAKRYYTMPAGIDRRTKVGKEAWAAIAADHEGLEPIAAKDMELILRWSGCLFANHKIRQLLEMEGPVEQSVIWTDEETGLPLKCRRDKYIPALNVILDIKTCQSANPAGFIRAVHRFGYHRTADWYIQGEQALHGEAPRYIFAAVSKVTGEAALHELGQRSTDLGNKQNRELLADMAKCYQSKLPPYFAWASQYELNANLIELPEHAFAEDAYAVEDPEDESEADDE